MQELTFLWTSGTICLSLSLTLPDTTSTRGKLNLVNIYDSLFLSLSLSVSLKALEAHPTSKTAAVVEEVLKRMVYGILSNKGLTPSNLLLFIHGTIKRTIPQLQPKPKYGKE